MHVEPGYLTQGKILLVDTAALGVLVYYAKPLLQRPGEIMRVLLAALFFTLFMQSFHLNVGPSELHFVGAMAMYLTLGFLPTLFGFALGLLLQGGLFEPGDLVHLAVNSLSLILPLLGIHYTLGRKLRAMTYGHHLSWGTIIKLDALYYSGVTALVGLWLLASEVATPFSAWATFASSYLLIVAVEPLFTYGVIRLLKRYEHTRWIDACFAVKGLRLVN